MFFAFFVAVELLLRVTRLLPLPLPRDVEVDVASTFVLLLASDVDVDLAALFPLPLACGVETDVATGIIATNSCSSSDCPMLSNISPCLRLY